MANEPHTLVRPEFSHNWFPEGDLPEIRCVDCGTTRDETTDEEDCDVKRTRIEESRNG